MKILTLILIVTLVSGGAKSHADPKPRGLKRNVEVEWEAVEDATGYEVQVTNKADPKKKPVRVRVKTAQWEVNVKPGLYLMQIRSYDDRGVPGEWSPPSELEVKLPSVESLAPVAHSEVKAQHASNETIHFQWEPVEGAKFYHFDLHSKTSDFKIGRDVSTVGMDADLPVAQDYEWTVQAFDERGQPGEPQASTGAFSLQGPALAKAKIDRPLSRYLTAMTWTPVDKAESYSAELSFKNPRTHAWEVVTQVAELKDDKLALDLARPSGRYRLRVVAHAARRPDSVPAQREFQFAGGFKSEDEMRLASRRDSLFKPTPYYAIASYLITEMQYTAKNYDLNSLPSVQAVGGTGRVGFGYQNQETPWGGFGIVDLSGFTINGQNFQFMSAEAHVTHTLELGQAGLLLIGSGLFYKQLPLVTGSESLGFEGVGKVSNIGPHLGFSYEIPLTERYGLQFNGRAYYSMLGSATNGGATQSSLSYQYGLLGSYRIDAMLKFYLGYEFRHDQANYAASPGSNSLASPGEVNSVTIEGNYLNVITEISF